MLTGYPLLRLRVSTTIQCFLSEECDCAAFLQFLVQIINVYADDRGNVVLGKMLSGGLSIASDWRKENENALFDVLRRRYHY